MAERNAAIHAARALLAELLVGPHDEELLEVVDALGGRALSSRPAVVPQEATQLAH
jgi:hypothetical protein